MKKISYSKTLDSGGGGKCRVYYSEKFKIVEKTVGDSCLRTKETNRARLTTLIRNYSHNENMLRKETIFLLFTQVARLDCCVEILDFSSNPFKIIMEYCEGGDLRKVLDEYEVPIQDKVEMISQILLVPSVRCIDDIAVTHDESLGGDVDNMALRVIVEQIDKHLITVINQVHVTREFRLFCVQFIASILRRQLGIVAVVHNGSAFEVVSHIGVDLIVKGVGKQCGTAVLETHVASQFGKALVAVIMKHVTINPQRVALGHAHITMNNIYIN